MSAVLSGDGDARRRLDELAKKYPRALAAALYQEGMDLWRDSVKRAPVEFGVLRNSAYVSPPQDALNPYVEVGYGTNYAVYQHEMKNLKHPRGGEAKFLQKAINAAAPTMLQRLADRTERNQAAGIGVDAIKGSAPSRPKTSIAARRMRYAASLAKKKGRKK